MTNLTNSEVLTNHLEIDQMALVPLHGILPLDEAIGAYSCTCKNPDCHSPGKHPRITYAHWSTLPTVGTLDRWLQQERWFDPFNWAIMDGLSGRRIIDIDPRNGGLETLEALERRYGPLPATQTVQTGGGGLHFHFADPSADADGDGEDAINLKLSTYQLATVEDRQRLSEKSKGRYFSTGVELLGRKHLSVIPPSVHKSGKPYRWLNSPADLPLAPLPYWVIELALEYESREKQWRGQHQRGPIPNPASGGLKNIGTHLGIGIISSGYRNRGLFEIGCRCRAWKWDESAIRQALHEVNRGQCSPPMDSSQVESVLKSVMKYPMGAFRNDDDLAAAEQFAELLDTSGLRQTTNQRSSTKSPSTVSVSVSFEIGEGLKQAVRSDRELEKKSLTELELKSGTKIDSLDRSPEYRCPHRYGIFMTHIQDSKLIGMRCGRWECDKCRKFHIVSWSENVDLRLHGFDVVFVSTIARDEWANAHKRIKRAEANYFRVFNESEEFFYVVCDKSVDGFSTVKQGFAKCTLLRLIKDPRWECKHISSCHAWKIPRAHKDSPTGYRRLGMVPGKNMSHDRIKEICDANGVVMKTKCVQPQHKPKRISNYRFFHPIGWRDDDVRNFYMQLVIGEFLPKIVDVEDEFSVDPLSEIDESRFDLTHL